MKIIVRKSDKLVLFHSKNLYLDNNKVGGDLICTEYSIKNSEIYDAEELPEDFFDGIYKYINGEFILIDGGQEKINAYKETVEQQRKEQIRQLIAKEAQEVLEGSYRRTLDRCYVAGVPLNEAWKNYRIELVKAKNLELDELPLPPMDLNGNILYPEGS